MANVATQFIDPDGTYTGGYTSKVVDSNFANHSSNATRAVFQVDWVSGTIDLQMRVSVDAAWLTVRTYTESMIEEIVIANYLRVVVSADAKCWVGETK